MYEPLYKSLYKPLRTDNRPAITQSDRRQMENSLMDYAGTTVGAIADALYTPSSYLYDFLRGEEFGSGSTGHDVLEDYGIGVSDDLLGGYARPVQDFIFEVITDPLNLLTMGAGSANKAFRAARAIGASDDIGRIASRKFINSVNAGTKTLDDASRVTKRAAGQFANETTGLGKNLDQLSDFDLKSRPLMGFREARKNLTLEDLIRGQDDAASSLSSADEALKNLNDFAAKKGGYDAFNTLEDFYASPLAKSNLGSDIGFRYNPFSLYGEVAGRIPGVDALSKTISDIPYLGAALSPLVDMDQATDWLRWSRAGRVGAKLFDNTVKNSTEFGDQVLSKSFSRADELADRKSSRKVAELLQELPEGAFDREAGQAVRAHIEGVATDAQTQLLKDKNLMGVRDKVRKELDDYLSRSRAAGIKSNELQDEFLDGYFPRSLDNELFDGGAGSIGRSNRFSLYAGDQMPRSAAYKVPGGTRKIQELTTGSNLDEILDAASNEEAGEIVYRLLGNPDPTSYNLAKATKLASDIRMANPDVLRERGFFGNHFTEDFARYSKSRERAIARAEVATDALKGGSVVEGKLPDGYISGGSAARQIGLDFDNSMNQQTVDYLKNNLGSTGYPVDDAAKWGVNPSTMKRLNRISNFETNPNTRGEFLKFLDNVTGIWKGSILSFPSRMSRDRYSGYFSNMLEVSSLNNLWNGTKATKYLLQGDFNDLEAMVRKMPRYADIQNSDEMLKAYRNDLASTNLLQGRRIEDIGTEFSDAMTGKNLRNSMLPGSVPETTITGSAYDTLTGRQSNANLFSGDSPYSELFQGKQYKKTGSEFLEGTSNGLDNYLEYVGKREPTNPILRYGARMSDLTDSMNRLDGYNALLLEGVDINEATKRIKAAQVDYQSLTNAEKTFFKRIFPFWTFSSRIGGYVGRKILNDPGGRFTQLGMRWQRSQDEDQEYVPQRIREQGGFNVDSLRDTPVLGSAIDMLLPETEDVNSFFEDIDLPGIDTLNMIDLQPTSGGSYDPFSSAYETGKNIVGDLAHPIIRQVVENLSGTNLYTGKDLNQFEPTLQKISRRYGDDYETLKTGNAGDRIMGGLSSLAEYVPFAPRALQIANRLTDTERVPDATARVLQTLMNATTGVKATNISEDARDYDAIKAIERLLRHNPYLRDFEINYIPKEYEELMNPQDRQFYELKKLLEKETRAARQAR